MSNRSTFLIKVQIIQTDLNLLSGRFIRKVCIDNYVIGKGTYLGLPYPRPKPKHTKTVYTTYGDYVRCPVQAIATKQRKHEKCAMVINHDGENSI